MGCGSNELQGSDGIWFLGEKWNQPRPVAGAGRQILKGSTYSKSQSKCFPRKVFSGFPNHCCPRPTKSWNSSARDLKFNTCVSSTGPMGNSENGNQLWIVFLIVELVPAGESSGTNDSGIKYHLKDGCQRWCHCIQRSLQSQLHKVGNFSSHMTYTHTHTHVPDPCAWGAC